MEVEIECTYCDGKGENFPLLETCRVCDGTGKTILSKEEIEEEIADIKLNIQDFTEELEKMEKLLERCS